MIFGIVVPFGLSGVGAELIVTYVAFAVVIFVGVGCNVRLLCGMLAGCCVPVLGLGGGPCGIKAVLVVGLVSADKTFSALVVKAVGDNL